MRFSFEERITKNAIRGTEPYLGVTAMDLARLEGEARMTLTIIDEIRKKGWLK